MKDPPDCGFSGLVIIIAFDACLTAKKTLAPHQPPYISLPILHSPSDIDPHSPHKLIDSNIRDGYMTSDDASI